MLKRKYKIKVINKGWFKKGNIPLNFGKTTSQKTKDKIRLSVCKSIKNLPEEVKCRIKKHQFKKGHRYAHWTGKYGEEHPRYRGKAYRNKALALKKKQCEKCGKQKFKSLHELHVHHKDRNRNNQNINNLKILCSVCHSKLHKNWEFRWGKSK